MEGKINQILQIGQKRGLLFASWLVSQGYSKQLLNRYRSSNWLSPLCRGVMYRTGETLSAFGALQSFNEQLDKHLRIAAHSALELWGFNHYVPMGKPLLMVATLCDKMPQWMKYDVFDREFKFFTTGVFAHSQETTLTYWDWKLLISSAEQAFMECLLLAPLHYNYQDLYYIMEQLTTLRPEMAQALLHSTNNYRVKRLFLYMAEKARHYWLNEIDVQSVDLGTHKLQLTKGGIYASKYKMTVPKELSEYE